MKNRVRIAAAVAGCVLSFALTAYAGSITVTGLETDHLVEPAHIGPTPSFSWRMETSRKDARQIAYRIRCCFRGVRYIS